VKQTFKPIAMEAEIELVKGTEAMKETAASIVKFPEHKTPDLLFFSGIFVSSGENLNKAYFLPSEMVKAHNTIVNKAVDIEHEESEIVGHIYDSKFVDKTGDALNIEELLEISEDDLNKMEMDVHISGIVYKSRFPELAKDVANKKWKLSMETYYQNYDVKIGNMILSRKEAEALGIASETVLGRMAKVLKNGKEIAQGSIARVLRELLFSGVGFVKNPANPTSVVLETAKKKNEDENMDDIVVEIEGEEGHKKDKEDADIDRVHIRNQTDIGICVSYKKRVITSTFEDPNTTVVRENWCTLYDKACTSASRDAHHPDCLRRKAQEAAKLYVADKFKQLEDEDRRGSLLSELKNLLK